MLNCWRRTNGLLRLEGPSLPMAEITANDNLYECAHKHWLSQLSLPLFKILSIHSTSLPRISTPSPLFLAKCLCSSLDQVQYPASEPVGLWLVPDSTVKVVHQNQDDSVYIILTCFYNSAYITFSCKFSDLTLNAVVA